MIWDVTQRRRTEQRLMHMTRLYDFLSQVNHAIVRSSDEQSLMDQICAAWRTAGSKGCRGHVRKRRQRFAAAGVPCGSQRARSCPACRRRSTC